MNHQIPDKGINLHIELDRYPEALHPPVEAMKRLIPYVGKYPPDILYTNMVAQSWLLFERMGGIREEEVHVLMDLLARMEPLMMTCEQHYHRRKFEKDERWEEGDLVEKKKKMEMILEGIEGIKGINGIGEIFVSLMELVMDMPKDGIGLEEVVSVFEMVLVMVDEAKEQDKRSKDGKGKKNGSMPEYLIPDRFESMLDEFYLFGGQLYTDFGETRKAIEIFISDIPENPKPSYIGHHLHGFKKAERLWQAQQLHIRQKQPAISEQKAGEIPEKKTAGFETRTNRMIFLSLQRTATTATLLLDQLREHPSPSLNQPWLDLPGGMVPWFGEVVSEPYSVARKLF